MGMDINIDIEINATKEEVWKLITDIENSAKNLSGIEKIEIINKPKDSVVGLKWKETRMFMGKSATEIMWITEAKENSFYKTRAESHGAIYISQLKITQIQNGSKLSMGFQSQPVSLGAKVMGFLMWPLIKKTLIKDIKKDLNDIKQCIENK